ncbi:MAG: hypothetical protein Q9215_006999 [Flavoplaca cf. flavocitrina]
MEDLELSISSPDPSSPRLVLAFSVASETLEIHPCCFIVLMQSQKVLRNLDTRSFTQLIHKIKVRVTTGRSDLPKHATIMSEQPLSQDTPDTRILWLLRWWLPELFASCLAVLAFISLVVLAKEYDHCGIEATNLPAPLTLNGLVALLSTLIRSTFMVATRSALSQIVWLSLSLMRRAHKPYIWNKAMRHREALGAACSICFELNRGLSKYRASHLTMA